LFQESKILNIQSEQISKLHLKIQEIDKWKNEVIILFTNQIEESQNYKRYRQHY